MCCADFVFVDYFYKPKGFHVKGRTDTKQVSVVVGRILEGVAPVALGEGDRY